MSVSLENLSAALTNMSQNLCDKIQDKQEYCIDKLNVIVVVEMSRTNLFNDETNKFFAFCGNKSDKNEVKVAISPLNEGVEELVASLFKNMIIPPMMGAGAVPKFDSIVINDRTIR